ncbi:thiamine phosphate synthase [Neopusillimonas maritima]|uniref:Thiamine-phosphate synthase n=1 Tax=Neopusillimonas maritima TaxID=2026239 RepID=A0A3A1Z0C2_9BURK|nr:thiamine phosphate synthase [Neopusillimonas maritima]RIY42184.1 thiamine phosphate synthase [Neopusillimonas maritima]
MTSHLKFPRGLYGITPEWTDFEKLVDAVEQAAEGGMTALQWRQKSLTGHEAVDKAGRLREICKRQGVVFIVNDSIDLALAVDADGVHLGREDGDPETARERVGPGKLIGASCYNELARAQQALNMGVDYVAFGAVYPSSVKPHAVKADLDLFQQTRALMAAMPEPHPGIVAIGGITPENAPPLVQAGATSVAVINGLFEANDIRAQAQRFNHAFEA